MGHIFQEAKIQNNEDLGMAKAGYIHANQVRALGVNFLVDTGATMICLPMDMIEQLGLDEIETLKIETADGPKDKRLFGSIRLRIMDRSGTFDVIELPDGTTPLLGAVPLQTLDLYPNPSKEILESNPKYGGKRVLYVL